MEQKSKGINYLKESKTIADDYIARYYTEAHEAKKKGAKVCWHTCAIHNALLHSFDIYTFMPEISAALTGFDNTCVPYQVAAEKQGYSQDICSYARQNIGEIFTGRTAEQGAMPAPDFLVTTGGVCTTYITWWQALQRHYKVPLFIFNSPYLDNMKDLYKDKIKDHHIKQYVARCEDFVHFLEEQTGKKFDPDKYKECIKFENQARELWIKILDYAKRVPSPVNDWDLFGPLIMILWFSGTKLPVDAYKVVLNELEERVKNHITAIPNERHRLLFISNPPWYKFETLPAWLAEVDALFVGSFFNESWAEFTNVGTGSFEEVANANIRVWVNCGPEPRINWAKKLIKDYKCDGLVTMDNRACKVISYGMYDIKNALEKDLGIPGLCFESNMCDPRYWSDDQIRSQFEDFVELLEED